MRSERHECRARGPKHRPSAALELRQTADGWLPVVEWALSSAGGSYALRPMVSRDAALRVGLGAILRDVRHDLDFCRRLGGVAAVDQRAAEAIRGWARSLLEPDLFAGAV